MFPLSRIGDANEAGGKIIRGSTSVFANGIPVGLHVSPITPHPSGPRHRVAVTTFGSPNVYCEGMPVLRVTSGNSCGHVIIQGSRNILVS